MLAGNTDLQLKGGVAESSDGRRCCDLSLDERMGGRGWMVANRNLALRAPRP